MRKIIRIALPALAVVILALFALQGIAPTLTLRITPQEAQAQIARRLPFEGRKAAVLGYRIDTVKVEMRADGRIGLDGVGSAALFGREIGFHGVGAGTPAYVAVGAGTPERAIEGAFYLDDLAIDRFEVTNGAREAADVKRLSQALARLGVDARLQIEKEKVAEKARQVFGQLLGDYFALHPVYVLKDADRKQAMARMVLQNIAVEDGKLVVTLASEPLLETLSRRARALSGSAGR